MDPEEVRRAITQVIIKLDRELSELSKFRHSTIDEVISMKRSKKRTVALKAIDELHESMKSLALARWHLEQHVKSMLN